MLLDHKLMGPYENQTKHEVQSLRELTEMIYLEVTRWQEIMKRRSLKARTEKSRGKGIGVHLKD